MDEEEFYRRLQRYPKIRSAGAEITPPKDGGANLLKSLFGDLSASSKKQLPASSGQQQGDDTSTSLEGFHSEGQFFWSNLRGFLKYYFPPEVADKLQKSFEVVHNRGMGMLNLEEMEELSKDICENYMGVHLSDNSNETGK
eukprot:gb/GECG01013270.1/.p1 GENE.gb/GECG01013270.1/~~gb/GECG01013270.1/.p1  ORF type:complete len:141 (+),score=32.02 gb/GECG01013270.1/:1-423(+)